MARQKDKEKGLFKSIKSLFLRVSFNLSLVSHRLRQFAEEALSSDEVVNELFVMSSSSSIEQSLLEDTSNTMTTTVNAVSVDDEAVCFQDFDPVHEAALLRTDDEPFILGPLVWERRRAAWLQGSAEQKLQARQRILDNTLTVPKENYPVVYSSLVERNKTLKKPMALKDALKVINAGWVANKKWERAAQGLN